MPGEERSLGSGCVWTSRGEGDWREPGNSQENPDVPTGALREGQAGADAAVPLPVWQGVA